jgi:lipoyl(octanoyl) transferase
MFIIRHLGLQPYTPIWNEMKKFTGMRDLSTLDELWLLEHPPVYTQGQAGKPEHAIDLGTIPLIKSDRGGQITYHAPGQLVAYLLMDIRRYRIGIRTLVCQLETVIIKLLHHYDISAQTRPSAPGVYVEEKKIASVGLRVKNGCTYHGIALNVAMDLNPYLGINPCGYKKLHMTQIKDFLPNITLNEVAEQFSKDFLSIFEQ